VKYEYEYNGDDEDGRYLACSYVRLGLLSPGKDTLPPLERNMAATVVSVEGNGRCTERGDNVCGLSRTKSMTRVTSVEK
jgi:hypothetical protein